MITRCNETKILYNFKEFVLSKACKVNFYDDIERADLIVRTTL